MPILSLGSGPSGVLAGCSLKVCYRKGLRRLFVKLRLLLGGVRCFSGLEGGTLACTPRLFSVGNGVDRVHGVLVRY